MSLKFAVMASLTVLCGVPAQADNQAANLGPIGHLTASEPGETRRRRRKLDVATKLCR